MDRFGLARLGLSVAYMTAHLAGSAWLPDQWPTSSSYSQTSLPARLLLLPLWCKVVAAGRVHQQLSLALAVHPGQVPLHVADGGGGLLRGRPLLLSRQGEVGRLAGQL